MPACRKFAPSLILDGHIEWRSGANRRNTDYPVGIGDSAVAPLSLGLCGRGHDLRSGGGTDTVDTGRSAFQPRHNRFRLRLRPNDGLRCAFRITINNQLVLGNLRSWVGI